MAIAFESTIHTATRSDTAIAMPTMANGACVARIDVESAQTVSGVTINGVAATQHQTSNFPGQKVELWSAPLGTTVAGNITCTVSGMSDGNFNGANYSFFSGVDQTTVLESTTQSTAAANSVSITVTPASDGAWGVAQTSKNGACAVDSHNNITNRYNVVSANTMQSGDSNGIITNGVGYIMTVTSSGCSQNHLLQGGVLKAASGGGAVAVTMPTLLMIGVG